MEMEQKKTGAMVTLRRGQKMTFIQNQLGAKNSVFGLLSQDVQKLNPVTFSQSKTHPISLQFA